jgi:hypothetical protein
VTGGKPDPNIHRAFVTRECPGSPRWWLCLAMDAEDVIDRKGSVLAVYESKKGAERGARLVTATIRDAVRADRKARRRKA